MTIDRIDISIHPDGIHRDRWQRPIMKTVTGIGETTMCSLCNVQVPGVAFMRMTRFIDVLEDKAGLEAWKLKQVAKGLALRGDLVLEIASHMSKDPTQEDDDKAINKAVDKAAEAAGSSAKARTGTALHKIIERIDNGENPVIPDVVSADIDAYRQLAVQERLTVRESEINIVIDGIELEKPKIPGVGGRFDMIVETSYPCSTCGHYRRIADLKTGRVDYGRSKMAMQLCGYSVGQRYIAEMGKREPLGVCQCWGLIIHLPAGQGKATPLWANLIEARQGLAIAYEVWKWRQRDDLLVENLPIDIGALIAMTGDRQSIANLYEQFSSTGQWTEQHTQFAQVHLAALERAQ